MVGWTGNPDFADDAFAAFYAGSAGVPRRLNLLAVRVMLHAAIEDLRVIDAAVVRSVQRDLEGDLPTLATDTGKGAAASVETLAQPVPVADTPRADPATEARIAALEARVELQDEALRRVLTLLVDWVESEDAKPEYAPIRGVSAWHDAA